MSNIPAKLRVLGVVKLLNAVSSVVVHYHYVLGVDVFVLKIRLISSPSFSWMQYNCKHYGPGHEPGQ